MKKGDKKSKKEMKNLKGSLANKTSLAIGIVVVVCLTIMVHV